MTKLANLLLLIAIVTTSVQAYDLSEGNDLNSGQFLLDVYLEDEGEALMIGYVDPEDLDDLSFLESSDYIYDKDTKELYVLTNSLTTKIEDCWVLNLNLDPESQWCGYMTVVYLPPETELKTIDLSEGLECEVTESESSVVLNIWGYDVEGPTASINYF